MGNTKRPPKKHSNHHDNPRNARSAISRRQHSQKGSTEGVKKPLAVKQHAHHLRQRIPFTRHDNILLLGEGDFSFTLSLKLHHKFHHITSTCFDSTEVLYNKYPSIAQTFARITPGAPDLVGAYGVSSKDDEQAESDPAWEGFSPSPSPPPQQKRSQNIDILCGIDATKLSSTHKKQLRHAAPFTKIVFNFPHVGGLSTDVNRQVRYNQELLVGFFEAARGLLSSPGRPATVAAPSDVYESDDEYFSDVAEDSYRSNRGAVNGQILVTLFEGEPYSLWNIRDLARHSGLKVAESFKFPWSAYPGYQHARTIGDISSGKDRTDEGKRKGAWRGEEREARCYVLEDKDAPSDIRRSKRKRPAQDDGNSE